jgi:hypothetical protein
LQTPCPPQPGDAGGQSALVVQATLQCMPFCMKVAHRPLAHSAFIVQVAPKTAPMPEPLLPLALLPALLVDDAVVLDDAVDPAPPLPPWPPPLVALAVAVVVSVVPPAPVPVLVVPLSPPQPAAMIPIPMSASIARIQSSTSFERRAIVRGSRRATMLHPCELTRSPSRKIVLRVAVYQR